MRLWRAVNDLRALRGALDWHTLVRAGRQLEFKASDQPEAYRVLVLSAHPGEEVLGCGGVIARHVKAGERVHAVIFCDGSRGTKSGIRDRLLGVKRSREAKLGLGHLGVEGERVTFWGYQDNKLTISRTTLELLRAAFESIQPELVYLPHFLDPDPDVRATNELFFAAATELAPSLRIMVYEGLRPVLVNRAVEITEMWAKKQAALGEHKSQLAVLDWLTLARSLNTYRGSISGMELAEGFFMVELKLYRKLFELMR